MKTYEQIMNETERSSIIKTEEISTKIIKELENIFDVYFPVMKSGITYGIMIQAILFDPTYRNYRTELVKLLDKYNVNEKNILFRFLAIVNQVNISEYAKLIYEDSFFSLPYCKYHKKEKNGYIIGMKSGIVEVYQLNKITRNEGLYSLINQDIFKGHCHEAVEICSPYLKEHYIITSELDTLFSENFYHSYFKSDDDREVIDVATNTLYKSNTFDYFYEPQEIQKIKSCNLQAYINSLDTTDKNKTCKVLKLAIKNKNV